MVPTTNPTGDAMKFQITGTSWPIGDRVIDPGTILDFDNELDHWSMLAKKSGFLQVNCVCLDAEGWAYANQLYPPHSYHGNQRPQLLAGVEVEQS
jgi:hypothetical protein